MCKVAALALAVSGICSCWSPAVAVKIDCSAHAKNVNLVPGTVMEGKCGGKVEVTLWRTRGKGPGQ